MLIDACCMIDNEGDGLLTAAGLVREMDLAGVDRAVVHPPDRCFAFENDEGNFLTTGAAGQHPGRLIAAVTVNPWRRDEYERLQKALDEGGRIVTFSPGLQGFNTSFGPLNKIMERLARSRPEVPVYVHTGHHSHGAPSQLFLLAGRFPEIRFILGHSGATDYATDVVPVCRQKTNIYVESSFARPPGFVGRLKAVGWDKGIMGSGWPLNNLAFEWSEMRRLLPAEHREKVLGGNLAVLLGSLE
jgi:uncharacterized protein